jgi:hypothetical protein
MVLPPLISQEYRVIQRLKDAVHTIVDDHAIVHNKGPPPFRYTLWPTGDELIVLIHSVYSKYTARK